jgi:pilus assembly protein Flp/PilA
VYDTYTYIRIRLVARPKSDRGASAVEYGLLVALIGIALIVGVSLLGGNLNKIFRKTSSSLS